MTSKMTYRPEIDGLRAVSVIAVLLFHAGLGCPGGYIGVDVFFVISGFLITGLIAKDLDNNSFSFASFWERRARRILPASLFVTAATLFFGWILFAPNELEDLARWAIAHLTFLSNVQAWRITLPGDAGYFAQSAQIRPLMHMWSLAIEEQFYLLFPILLYSMRRFHKNTLIIVLSSLLLLSLSLSVWRAFYDQHFAFYLLPARSWELLTGSLLALAIREGNLSVSSRAANVLSWIGLASIVAPIFLYTEQTPFPGLAALPPCLGCAAIIYSNTQSKTIVGRLLSKKPMIFIGLISYSLYLWHWPIFACYKTLFGLHIETGTSLLLAAISVLVGWFSWRFIESPFRLRQPGTRQVTVFVQAACCSLLLLAISVTFWKISDLSMPARISSESIQVDITNTGKEFAPPFSEMGQPGTKIDFLLWGDSHSGSVAKAIDEAATKTGLTGRAAVKSGTAPLPGAWRKCETETLKWNDDVRAFIRTHKIKHVILVARWSVVVDGGDATYTEGGENGSKHYLIDHQSDDQTSINAQRCLSESLDSLAHDLSASGVKLWILKQVPEQSQRRILSSWIRSNLYGCGWLFTFEPPPVSREQHNQRQANANAILDAVAATNNNVSILDGSSAFFMQGETASVIRDNHCLYRDANHLSYSGSKLVVNTVFKEVLSAIRNDKTNFIAEESRHKTRR